MSSESIMGTSFPDESYVLQLTRHLEAQVAAKFRDDPIARLIAASSALGDPWMSYYFGDMGIVWEKRSIPIDDLTLTGVHPEWHPWIAEYCGRSPAKLRQLLRDRPDLNYRFTTVEHPDIPILVNFEEGEFRILDGMHRVVSAIVEGWHEIEAYVVYPPPGGYRPTCEPHVVNDLIRLFYRGMDGNPEQLLAALILLKNGYSNVEGLLEDSLEWLTRQPENEVILEVITKALNA